MPLDEDLEDYETTLSELKTNSKPNINALTLLAEDYRNKNHSLAEGVVRLIETRLQRVIPTQKLPLMYLLDSIVKNVGEPYKAMFTENIVTTFCNTFERVDQATRSKLYKLRTTWNTLFPVKMLSLIDSRIKAMDPSWPLDPQSPALATCQSSSASNTQQRSEVMHSTSSNSHSSTATTNIHINPRVYPHFPLTNQLGANPAVPMYYGHSNVAAAVNSSASANSQSESRDPRLRGKAVPVSQQSSNSSQTGSVSISMSQAITSSALTTPHFPFPAMQALAPERPQDHSNVFPFFGMPPMPVVPSPVSGLVQAQMPGGAIVQLTPEQLKAAAAVAPIPGVDTGSMSSGTSNNSTSSDSQKSATGSKPNKPDQAKKKVQKPQPKRPLSPWRTRRASPPNFMREEKSSDRERGYSSGSERRRADSEGKRKRPGSAGSDTGDQGRNEGSHRGRSSSPGPAKKKSSMGDSEEKGDDIRYGSKRSKDGSGDDRKEGERSSEEGRSGVTKGQTSRGGGNLEQPPAKPKQRTIGRAQAQAAAKLSYRRMNNLNHNNNNNRNDQNNSKENDAKASKSKGDASNDKSEKKSAEEGFIPIKNDVQVGKKDVDYRGVRGSSGGGQSIRVAGMRKVGTGVPEVITPEQVYARAEMLLKSGKLTPQQCNELQEQIKEVQRRREKDTEKKASTDFDLRRAPNNRNGPSGSALVRRPVPNSSENQRNWPNNRGGFNNQQMRFAGPPLGARGDMRMRQPNPPPQFRGPMRGNHMQMQRGGRMPMDQRWRNVAPPRFPSNMQMRQPQRFMGRPMPPRPPEFPPPPRGNNQNSGRMDGPRSLSPTEVYQFGPGYGYSSDWDRYYDKHGLEWPREMPFDSRFAGPQLSRMREPGPPSSVAMRHPVNMHGSPNYQPPMHPPNQMSGASIHPPAPYESGVADTSASLDDSNVDLNCLFNRLIDMGMISSSSTLAEEEGLDAEEEEDESLKFKPSSADTEPLADVGKISFDNESLKEYHFGVIQRMYRGLQCSSCGMRYPIDKQSQYTAHLDWHFRQKRRKADGYVGSSREWFPLCEDWFVLADHADRLSAGFGEESAAKEMMQTSANDNVVSNSESVEAEKMSVCADSRLANDEICKICREYFEQFWHVTAEEWHFLDAIRVEGKTVHFFCYKEFTDAGNGPTVPPTPRTMSIDSAVLERPPSSESVAEVEKSPAKQDVAPNSSGQASQDDVSKPQHSLGSLNSILSSLTGEQGAVESTLGGGSTDEDDDEGKLRIKEEPKDWSEDQNQPPSSGASVLLKIKDEPMDESELELQVIPIRPR